MTLRAATPVAVLLVLLNAISFAKDAQAQIIRIKLLDGRNGHPVPQACVNVGVDNLKVGHMLALPTNADGVAQFRFTNVDSEVNIQSSWPACGDSGVIDPIMKYSDGIGINVGYVLCQTRKADYSWLTIRTFSTIEVLRHGIVTGNTCGKATASAQLGEVIIFVRPLTWWEKFKT